MKKLSLAPNDVDQDLARATHVLRETDWMVPDDLPVVDLIELYLGIDTALSADRGVAIQFVGASAGSGSAEVALDMAWAAASVLGKKLLVLNCTPSQWTSPLGPLSPAGEMGPHHPTPMNDDLIKVNGQEMYLADLQSWTGKSNSLAKVDEIGAHLEEFCRYFDMVVVVAPPADGDPLGAVLAGHVDGNVLVIEAEQTRRAAAIRLRQMLARCGRPILGAVLHDRRDHIPRWMARLL
ncbi:tyrosine-protein kinase family protein [Telmatospirillum siberiense]|uniref:CpsD/CapB family tyrosine-protein kinase n=1 Tax=Telmatospirillum siberiense TaxID=382514 RepID=A0A2N3PS52_9PROT|nr:tyrosine-protein kinase family protein [Telmatospirillum siberiense]PKU23230.1 hypothetical protein CWS72_17550 [Telmatospirillum siberiense]